MSRRSDSVIMGIYKRLVDSSSLRLYSPFGSVEDLSKRKHEAREDLFAREVSVSWHLDNVIRSRVHICRTRFGIDFPYLFHPSSEIFLSFPLHLTRGIRLTQHFDHQFEDHSGDFLGSRRRFSTQQAFPGNE